MKKKCHSVTDTQETPAAVGRDAVTLTVFDSVTEASLRWS